MIKSYFCAPNIIGNMHLEQRINLLADLGSYMVSDETQWQQAKAQAYWENGWFTPEFVKTAVDQIADGFLSKEKLRSWAGDYHIPEDNPAPRLVGLVMAGNIPLVGFHDFLAIFLSGHRQMIKTSSKDNILITHLIQQIVKWAPEAGQAISMSAMLKGCDAYVATGGNNAARYFEYYFARFPHIIRRNRTSVAILTGQETKEDLENLAEDIQLYFGLGCRNVTKIYVPESYDFVPLLGACDRFNYLADQHKYKNNYDYQLTLLILNKKAYMSNESILLVEDPSLFSPISVLHYEYYSSQAALAAELSLNNQIQCIIGKGYIPFGQAQRPDLTQYADGVDTLKFLMSL